MTFGPHKQINLAEKNLELDRIVFFSDAAVAMLNAIPGIVLHLSFCRIDNLSCKATNDIVHQPVSHKHKNI
ncbi:MAG: hypothetical protein JNL23_10370 [Chitinophagaceae bacterium]|nr:hypothetical protein [Chitinophagaceae bacterium]